MEENKLNPVKRPHQKTQEDHDYVRDILFDLVKADENTYRSEDVHKSIAIPKSIECKSQLEEYEPDVWAKAKHKRRKFGSIDIFEVWHTQTTEKSFCDLLNSFDTGDFGYLCIVLMNRKKFKDPWKKPHVRDIKARMRRLLNKSGKEALNRVVAIEVDDDDLRPRNKNKLRTKIGKKFQLL